MSTAWISKLSIRVAVLERSVCCVLVVSIVVLILLNVTMRAFDLALFWVDELAVYTMIWMALVGASMLLQQRGHIAVTLLTGALPDRVRHSLVLLVDLLILAFALGLLIMCLAWYDPIGLFQYGLNIEEFAASTFNFIYQEPTNTLGIKKFWVWLVVPMVSMAMSLHALANLLEDLSGGNES